MGNIIRPGRVPMRVVAEIIESAPIERVDVLHGTTVAQTFRSYSKSDLGRRVRVLWQGAEYRGRVATLWEGKLKVAGNRIERFAPVNFLNPERIVRESTGPRLPGTRSPQAIWRVWTFGSTKSTGASFSIDTNIVSGTVELAALADNTVAFDGGGLGRQLSVYRLPETEFSRHVILDHTVSFAGGTDFAGLPACHAGRRPSSLASVRSIS